MDTMPPPVRVQDAVRELVLGREPRLSTGAYGDEGQLILELENAAVDGLGRGDFRLAASWLRNESLPCGHPHLEMWLLLAEGLLKHWTPLRGSMGAAGRARAKDQAFRSLTRAGAGDSAANWGFFERLADVIDRQELLPLERGGARWTLLHQADLLATLGPFIREREPLPKEIMCEMV